MHACALGQAALRQKPRSSLGADGFWVAHLCLRGQALRTKAATAKGLWDPFGAVQVPDPGQTFSLAPPK